MNLSDTNKTATAGTATCAEINNNQSRRNRLLGDNFDEANGELLYVTDTGHIHNAKSRAVRNRTIINDKDETTVAATGKQMTSNGATTSYRSNSDTNGESTNEDVDEPMFGNDSDWFSTVAFQRRDPDYCLPFQSLKYPTAGLAVFFVSVLCFCISYDAAGVFDDRAAIWENPDVSKPDNTPWQNVFRNDFWGKDLQWNMSHKSYRPLTTLSFR